LQNEYRRGAEEIWRAAIANPSSVRPAIGVRLSPRSLRQAPRFEPRAKPRAGPGIRVSRILQDFERAVPEKQKTLRSVAREGPW
jgi:hypothetical protein